MGEASPRSSVGGRRTVSETEAGRLHRDDCAAPVPALRWRLILDGRCGPAENMARDHALARCARSGHGTVRFYGWAEPTVSFGRNEPARSRFRREGVEAAIEAADVTAGVADAGVTAVRFVRRPTGGRALLHDDEVTYSVVAPLGTFGRTRDAYVAINRALVDGLVALGVPATVSQEGRVRPLDAGPCFQSPTAGEIVAGTGKLVGSAQARIDGALLQHGSVILDGDQALLSALGGVPFSGPRPARATRWIDSTLGPTDIARALADAFRLAWGGRWMEAPYTPEEEAESTRLQRERYSRTDWTWRR